MTRGPAGERVWDPPEPVWAALLLVGTCRGQVKLLMWQQFPPDSWGWNHGAGGHLNLQYLCSLAVSMCHSPVEFPEQKGKLDLGCCFEEEHPRLGVSEDCFGK